MTNETRVVISKNVAKSLTALPLYIQEKFYLWIYSVEQFGIREIRQTKGFHDEPLVGKRLGQRSVRLNKSYRAINTETCEGHNVILNVIEVNNHDY